MSEIRKLDLMVLHEHPDNPRRDVGDVTELADSIRTMGVMQNLTVIPSSEVQEGAETGYTVVIGHRRLAAARAAGLPDVLCVVTHMTREEQLATMLSENMQRVDLTIPEQVYGIQMMFSLGADEETVVKRTGLSAKTVRQRAKLAGLPEEEFRAAHENGATLDDYIKISQIKSPEKQRELLNEIGTENYRYSIRMALDKQIIKQKSKLIEAKMKELGIAFDNDASKRWSSKYDTVLQFPIKDYDPDNAEHPLNRLTAKDGYIWVKSYGDCCILNKIKNKKNEKPKKSKKEIEADNCRAMLRKKLGICYETRKAFIEEFTDWEKYGEFIDKEFVVRMVDLYVSDSLHWRITSLKEYIGYEGYPGEEKRLDYVRRFCEKERRAKLLTLWHLTSDCEDVSPAYEGYGENKPKLSGEYKMNEWKRVYTFLGQLGYEMSSEEQALTDGTSEVYR